MKKLLLVLSLLSIPYLAFAIPQVYYSSFTATADTTQNICINKRGFLHSVVVSSGAIGSNTITVWASSGTVNSTMTIINSSTQGSYIFDAPALSTNTNHTGLTYSTVGSADITILYDCY